MNWRDKIAKALMGRAERAPPAMSPDLPISPYDPRVTSRLQFDRAQGGLVVGDEGPMGWASNYNVYRPPADVLPFDPYGARR